MKPGSRRAETDWAETPYPETILGSAATSAPKTQDPVAVLWIPDPEQRHWFREFYVYPPDKPARSVGFRKR